MKDQGSYRETIQETFLGLFSPFIQQHSETPSNYDRMRELAHHGFINTVTVLHAEIEQSYLLNPEASRNVFVQAQPQISASGGKVLQASRIIFY